MLRVLVVAAALVLATGSVALAQPEEKEEKTGPGLRLGLGVDPDQFVAGVQLHMGKLFDAFRFSPSVDLGLGDDVTTLSFNADFLLIDTSLPSSDTKFYAGFGPTLTHWDSDHFDGDLEIGVSIVGGMRLPFGETRHYTGEVRIGFSDVPDLRFLIGIAL